MQRSVAFLGVMVDAWMSTNSPELTTVFTFWMGCCSRSNSVSRFDAVVWDAADGEEAHARLTSEPFSFSATQAHHILDASLRRRTVADRARLSTEAAELRAALDG